MYPYPILFDLTLYELLIVVGFISALVIYRILADREGIGAKVQNLCLFGGLAGLVGGYCIAVVTQAFYNYMDSGVFEINSHTGATFLGGLLGGAAIFLSVYFGIGHFVCRDRANIRQFWRISDFAAAGIASAHGFGRLGCLFAGCCYGRQTTSPLGIYMPGIGKTVIPVQLYEAIFLFILAAVLIVRTVRFRYYSLPLYMVLYGVWRYFIEYLRGDDRGATVVSFLSPSQLVAFLLVIGAFVVFIFEKKYYTAHGYPPAGEEKRETA